MTTPFRAKLAFAYSVAVTMISLGILCGFTVWFSQHAINENNQKFCGVLQAVTTPRPAPPDPDVSPVTEYGKMLRKYTDDNDKIDRKIFDRLNNLSKEYKCRSQSTSTGSPSSSR